MKLKRLIAFSVVMAVVMSCFCAVSTTVSADAIPREDTSTYHIWDGTVIGREANSKPIQVYPSNTKYGKVANDTEGWTKFGAGYLFSTSMHDKFYVALAGTAQNTGYVMGKTDDAVRGKYYEYTYASLRSNVYNHIDICTVCTGGSTHPVLGISYYFKIPNETAAKTRNTIITLKNNSGHSNSTSTTTNSIYLLYDANDYNPDTKTGKLKLDDRTGTLKKVWGTDEVTVPVGTWFKPEIRAVRTADGKLGMGLYVDDVQYAYFETTKVGYVEHLTIHQLDFQGPSGTESPGLTYFDDLVYCLATPEHAPLTSDPNAVSDEITLSAEGNVATATITGYNDITDARLVAALYNGDTFAGVASSNEISGENGIRTITCNFPTGVNYTKYKLFLFDDYGTLKPLTPMVEKPIN